MVDFRRIVVAFHSAAFGTGLGIVAFGVAGGCRRHHCPSVVDAIIFTPFGIITFCTDTEITAVVRARFVVFHPRAEGMYTVFFVGDFGVGSAVVRRFGIFGEVGHCHRLRGAVREIENQISVVVQFYLDNTNALLTLRALRTRFALFALRALRTRFALLTLRALGTCFALFALGALRTCFTLNTACKNARVHIANPPIAVFTNKRRQAVLTVFAVLTANTH